MAQQRAGRNASDEKEAGINPGKTFFLGIGIDAYEHWPKLNNAVGDVEAIADLLIEQYGVEPAHTKLLKDQGATEDQIIQAFEHFADTVKAPDSLLIYYAGHGHLNNRKRGFWVPVDAPKGKVTRLIRNSTIRDYIGDIPSLHTLLISASCFSGALFVRGERGETLPADKLLRLPSRWAISSGRQDEPVADGDKGKHSPFAQSVLDVLRDESQAAITAGFLYEQVGQQTRANANQNPDGGALAGVGHKRGQYVFRKKEKIDLEAEKVKELREEIEEALQLLDKRQHRKANRRFTGIRKGVEEELKEGPRQVNLLKELDHLIQFCRVFPSYLPMFERILLSTGKKEMEQYQQQINTLQQQLEEAKQTAQQAEVSEEEALQAEQTQKKLAEKTAKKLANLQIDFQGQEETIAKLQETIQKWKEKSVRTAEQPSNKDMVFIEGGTFQMGDVMEDREEDDEEVHQATIGDYYLSRYAVTFAEYDAFCDATGTKKPEADDDERGQHPVVYVPWADSLRYCNWRSQKEGLSAVYTIKRNKVAVDWMANGYRLPTEAEWEFAARQRGQKVRFGNGKDLAHPKEMNYLASDEEERNYAAQGEDRDWLMPVGGYKLPNQFGLHEMSGNVCEWCWDEYTDNYQPDMEKQSLPKAGDGIYRIAKGGSWGQGANEARCAARGLSSPDGDILTGFRLAMSSY